MSSRDARSAEGCCSICLEWMPFRCGFKNGPSQWTPSDSAPADAFLSVAGGAARRGIACKLLAIHNLGKNFI